MSEKVQPISVVGSAGLRVTGYDLRVGPTMTHLDLYLGTVGGEKAGTRSYNGPKITLNLEDRIEGEIIKNLIRAHRTRRQNQNLNERLRLGLIKELPAVQVKMKTTVQHGR